MFGIEHQLKEQVLKAEAKYFSLLEQILKELKYMSIQLDALTAQVTANNALLTSATQMINGIAAQITAAGTDPVALQALTDSLTANDTKLASAILANTPVVVVPTSTLAAATTPQGATIPANTAVTVAPASGAGNAVPVVTSTSISK